MPLAVMGNPYTGYVVIIILIISALIGLLFVKGVYNQFNEGKQSEESHRKRFITTSYDVTEIVYAQAMEIAATEIKKLEEKSKTSPFCLESFSTHITLRTYPDYYQFLGDNGVFVDNVFFVKDLHKKDLNNQIEADAFSYAVLHRVHEAISKTPHSIPLTLTLSQEEMTLSNQKLNQMRAVTLTITVENNNITPSEPKPTDWVKLN